VQPAFDAAKEVRRSFEKQLNRFKAECGDVPALFYKQINTPLCSADIQ
jgi:hypothetical protein